METPGPCEIRQGLRPVPHVDLALAATCEQPFVDVIRTAEGVEILSVGVNGGFVNREDFQEWMAHVSDGFKPKNTVLDNKALEWAIGMLWPDQSYANMRKFRGPQRVIWGPFHNGQMEMLTGDYN